MSKKVTLRETAGTCTSLVLACVFGPGFVKIGQVSEAYAAFE